MDEWKKTKEPGVLKHSDGRIRVRASARHPQTNKPLTSRQLTLPAGTTLREAVARREQEIEAMQEQARAERQDSAPVITLADYSEQWIMLKAARLKPRPAKTYAVTLALHILPHLGEVDVNTITRGDVERWVIWSEQVEQPDGKPYTQATLASWWRVLAMLLRDAAAEFGIPDPTARVRPPKVHRAAAREQGTLSHEELGRLLVAAEQYTPTRAVEIATLAYTGIRAGELYGLHWVDVGEEMLTICASASQGHLTDTKTHTSRRVYLPAQLAELLQRHRMEQLAAQHPGLHTGLVFPSDTGTLRDASSLADPLKLASEGAGLEIDVTPQVLRRTYNTLLVAAGADRIVLRSLMGHSSEQMTVLYANVRDESKRAAVMEVFGKGRP
jgi:integrase